MCVVHNICRQHVYRHLKAPRLRSSPTRAKKVSHDDGPWISRLTASFWQGFFTQRGELVHLVATETGSEALVDLQDARVYLL